MKYQYIVVSKEYMGSPLQEVDGILYHGDCVTLYPNYSAARRAIQRTAKYADDHGLKWDVWAFKPMRVVPKKP